MINNFKNFDSILQKQLATRLALTVFGVIVDVLIVVCRCSWQLIVPGLIFTLVCLLSSLILYRKCAKGDFVMLTGNCCSIERTGLRRRIKAIYVQCEDKVLRIAAQVPRVRNLSVGDKLTIYLPLEEPVYDHDGCLVIFHFIAIGKEW